MTRTVRWLAPLLVLACIATLGVVDQYGARLEARGNGMVSDGRWEIVRGALTLDDDRVRAGGEQIAAGEKLAAAGRRLDMLGWWQG